MFEYEYNIYEENIKHINLILKWYLSDKKYNPKKITFELEVIDERFVLFKDYGYKKLLKIKVKYNKRDKKLFKKLDEEINKYLNEEKGKNKSLMYAYVKREEFLEYAYEYIEKYGFLSSKNALRLQQKPTSVKVFRQLYLGFEKGIEIVTNQAKLFVKEVLNWIKNNADRNDFYKKLYKVCKEEYIKFDDIDMLICLIPSFMRELRYRKNLIFTNSKFIGSINEEIDKKVKLLKKQVFNTKYGILYVYKFIDDEENIIIYKSNYAKKLFDKVKEGEIYNIKGLIKKHEEYNDEKRTVVSKIILTEI